MSSFYKCSNSRNEHFQVSSFKKKKKIAISWHIKKKEHKEREQ